VWISGVFVRVEKRIVLKNTKTYLKRLDRDANPSVVTLDLSDSLVFREK